MADADVDVDVEGMIHITVGISLRLTEDEDVVKAVVDLNYVRMPRFLGFCIRRDRSCDLWCLCDRCIRERFSRRKRKFYSLSWKTLVCAFNRFLPPSN